MKSAEWWQVVINFMFIIHMCVTNLRVSRLENRYAARTR